MPIKKEEFEMYKGYEIRLLNPIKILVPGFVLKEIIDERERNKGDDGSELSFRQIIGISCKPCQHCQGKDAIATIQGIGEVRIKRGLLSNSIPKYSTVKKNTDAKSDRDSKKNK